MNELFTSAELVIITIFHFLIGEFIIRKNFSKTDNYHRSARSFFVSLQGILMKRLYFDTPARPAGGRNMTTKSI